MFIQLHPAYFVQYGLCLLASCSLLACGGGGGSSDSTAAVTVPGAPSIGLVTAGNASASVAFSAPSSNGGASITGYIATCAAGSILTSGSGTASPVLVVGLTNSLTYNCSVSATNSVGASLATAAVSVTPTAGLVTSGTNAVLCNVLNSGTQALSYNTSVPGGTATLLNDNLAFNYSWTCDSASRNLSGNGVPNHVVTGGNFASRVTVQNVSVGVSLTPAVKSASTPVKLPGFALNSVKMDPGTAGTCTNSASSVMSGCNYAGGSGAWRMEAMGDPAVSPWKFDFGTDENNAHVQPNGQYHYHGMPTHLISKLNVASATSMSLVGWAADGFPIYANLGYNSANNSSSALREMQGSFRTKATPDVGRPSTNLFAMGHFQQDWEYVAGAGDLDECNGRTGVTPEFPAGTYHYYITKTYPFIQRCVKGTPAAWANSLP